MMTKKDFQLLAEFLGRAKKQFTIEELESDAPEVLGFHQAVEAVVSACSASNSAFHSGKFHDWINKVSKG